MALYCVYNSAVFFTDLSGGSAGGAVGRPSLRVRGGQRRNREIPGPQVSLQDISKYEAQTCVG